MQKHNQAILKYIYQDFFKCQFYVTIYSNSSDSLFIRLSLIDSILLTWENAKSHKEADFDGEYRVLVKSPNPDNACMQPIPFHFQGMKVNRYIIGSK